MLQKFLHAIYSFLLIFSRDITATVTNRTIDDEFGDSVTGLKPIFLPTIPATAWEGEACAGCRVKPDKALAFKETFNAATARPDIGPISIGLSFKGTAIYVFFIIANDVPGDITTLTECNFTLDGQHAGYYRHEPSTDTNFQYNVPVFSTIGLANVDHNLNVSADVLKYHIFVNFDYAIYTFDDTPEPTSTTPTIQPSTNPHSSIFVTQTGTTSSAASRLDSSSKIPVGSIVGGVVGGLFALGLLLLLIFCRRRKRLIKVKNRPLTPAPGYNSNGLITNAGLLNGSRSLDRTSFSSQYTPRYIRDEISDNIMENPNPSVITTHVSTTSPSSVNESRSIRRARLERQLRAIERELANLGTGSRVSSRPPSSREVAETNAETMGLRRQMVQMRELIDRLQTQNFSEPPPSYSE